MDVGDLVYIAVFVGGILISIIKEYRKGQQQAAKRKQQVPTSETQEKKEKTFFDEILDQLNQEKPEGGELQEEAMTIAEEKEAEAKEQKRIAVQEEKDDRLDWEKQMEAVRKKKEAALAQRKERREAIEMNEKNRENDADFDFEPAKAIIYSEILKRPDF